jgi:Beta propeller domain
VRLALISTKSLQNTYLGCRDLAVDLRKLAQLIANKTIQSNLGSQSCYFNKTDCPIYFAAPMEGDMASSSAGEQKSDSVTTTESSYGTNNQVEGVEEPDIIQSDGKSIFLAYLSIDYQGQCRITKDCQSDEDSQGRQRLPGTKHSTHALD